MYKTAVNTRPLRKKKILLLYRCFSLFEKPVKTALSSGTAQAVGADASSPRSSFVVRTQIDLQQK